MAIRHYVYAAGTAAGLALFAACGDDVTEVTNVNGKASFEQVKKFKELPKCDEDAEGSLVYVKDSAKVFVCTGDGWSQLDGSDGSDGKNGKNGTSGDDGSSCVAKQNKKKTGFDVICDGKTVGSIVNGSDGKDGKDGGDGSMNCSVKQNKKKTGFDVICDGKTVGTITNGSAGEDCSLTEGENGTAVVKCGENGESVTLSSAYCGAKNFDPATQFCGSDLIAYPLCEDAPEDLAWALHSDGTYDVDYYFCDATDVLLEKCGGLVFDNETQFCDRQNKEVLDRCDSVAEGVDDNALLEGNVFDPMLYFCAKGALYEKCGGETFDPELQFCDEEEGKPVALCDGLPYDIENEICVDGKVESAFKCCEKGNAGENWCNAHPTSMYDVRKQFCDNRDGTPYMFDTIVGPLGTTYSEIWMLENLKFDPKDDDESSCPENVPANCDTHGRLYTWDAAYAYCPTGWHLPTKAEYEDLRMYDGTTMVSWYFNVQKAGWFNTNSDKWQFFNSYMELWTATEYSQNGDAYGTYVRDGDFYITNDYHHPKTYQKAVRCIKNKKK